MKKRVKILIMMLFMQLFVPSHNPNTLETSVGSLITQLTEFDDSFEGLKSALGSVQNTFKKTKEKTTKIVKTTKMAPEDKSTIENLLEELEKAPIEQTNEKVTALTKKMEEFKEKYKEAEDFTILKNKQQEMVTKKAAIKDIKTNIAESITIAETVLKQENITYDEIFSNAEKKLNDLKSKQLELKNEAVDKNITVEVTEDEKKLAEALITFTNEIAQFKTKMEEEKKQKKETITQDQASITSKLKELDELKITKDSGEDVNKKADEIQNLIGKVKTTIDEYNQKFKDKEDDKTKELLESLATKKELMLRDVNDKITESIQKIQDQENKKTAILEQITKLVAKIKIDLTNKTLNEMQDLSSEVESQTGLKEIIQEFPTDKDVLSKVEELEQAIKNLNTAIEEKKKVIKQNIEQKTKELQDLKGTIQTITIKKFQETFNKIKEEITTNPEIKDNSILKKEIENLKVEIVKREELVKKTIRGLDFYIGRTKKALKSGGKSETLSLAKKTQTPLQKSKLNLIEPTVKVKDNDLTQLINKLANMIEKQTIATKEIKSLYDVANGELLKLQNLTVSLETKDTAKELIQNIKKQIKTIDLKLKQHLDDFGTNYPSNKIDTLKSQFDTTQKAKSEVVAKLELEILREKRSGKKQKEDISKRFESHTKEITSVLQDKTKTLQDMKNVLSKAENTQTGLQETVTNLNIDTSKLTTVITKLKIEIRKKETAIKQADEKLAKIEEEITSANLGSLGYRLRTEKDLKLGTKYNDIVKKVKNAVEKRKADKILEGIKDRAGKTEDLDELDNLLVRAKNQKAGTEQKEIVIMIKTKYKQKLNEFINENIKYANINIETFDKKLEITLDVKEDDVESYSYQILNQITEIKEDINYYNERFGTNGTDIKGEDLPDTTDPLIQMVNDITLKKAKEIYRINNPGEESIEKFKTLIKNNASLDEFTQFVKKNKPIVENYDVIQKNKKIQKGGTGKTFLHFACEKGNIFATESILKEKAYLDIDTKDSYGNAALHLACKYRIDKIASKLIEKLINNKANFKEKGAKGNTPLHFACEQGNDITAKTLINERGKETGKWKWDYNQITTFIVQTNGKGQTPLMLRCKAQNDDPDLIGLASTTGLLYPLVGHENIVNDTDGDGKNALDYACKAGNVEIVDYLVAKKDGIIRSKSYLRGTTAINAAIVKQRHRDIVSSSGNKNYEGILKIFNKAKPALEITRPLKDAVASISELENYINESGYSLFKINENSKNKKNSPLHLACKIPNNIKVVEYILEKVKSSISVKNDKGELPLHVACRNPKNITVVEKLLEIMSKSALHSQHEMLLEKAREKTPLDEAIDANASEITEILIRRMFEVSKPYEGADRYHDESLLDVLRIIQHKIDDIKKQSGVVSFLRFKFEKMKKHTHYHKQSLGIAGVILKKLGQ